MESCMCYTHGLYECHAEEKSHLCICYCYSDTSICRAVDHECWCLRQYGKACLSTKHHCCCRENKTTCQSEEHKCICEDFRFSECLAIIHVHVSITPGSPVSHPECRGPGCCPMVKSATKCE